MISVEYPRSKIGVLSTKDLSVNWEGFLDEESGVKEFYMGVGSTNTSTDILDFISVDGEFAEIKHSDSMVDGYQYYVILKVIQMKTTCIDRVYFHYVHSWSAII